MSINKCELVKREIKWCGRIFNKDGWTFNKKYFERILSMKYPVKVGDIEDIVYMSSWLSAAIPKCAEKGSSGRVDVGNKKGCR